MVSVQFLALLLLAVNIAAVVQLWRLRNGLVWLGGSRGHEPESGPEKHMDVPLDQETAVILCVRGADPSLPDCLAGLTMQTHSQYTVHAVADHASDPALPWLSRSAALDQRIQLHQLASPPVAHRGLKVSAILQVLRELPSTVKHVAFIDSDVIPHSSWLCELTAPLSQDAVVATTGTRWFMPARDNFGSLVRQEWNYYANAIIVQHQMLWGGSFATRADELRQAVQRELWADTLCEDTCLADLLRRQGRPAVIVPMTAMINRETCSLRGACDFITRQLVFTRMYLSAGLEIVLFGVTFSLLCLVSTVAVAVLAVTGPVDAWLVTLVAYLLLHGSVLALEQVGSQIPGILQPHRNCGRPPRSWKLLPAQFVCAGVSLVASLRALLATSLTWRGIQYRIQRRHPRIQMVQYRPFAEVLASDRSFRGTGGRSI
ncbi:MAG TPA: hypothetical protein DDY91_08780 [Planctomycetaceae bacterium]|nr:hypothetical protein [Planctomycetaceae bacterium]